jgi:hypothetical protein
MELLILTAVAAVTALFPLGLHVLDVRDRRIAT